MVLCLEVVGIELIEREDDRGGFEYKAVYIAQEHYCEYGPAVQSLTFVADLDTFKLGESITVDIHGWK